MIRENVVETINELKGEAGHKRVLDIYNSQCPLPRGYRLQEKDLVQNKTKEFLQQVQLFRHLETV